MKRRILTSLGAFIAVVAIIVMLPTTASAHCDTMDGPVINDAKKAIEENNINYIAKWVSPEEEAELNKLFNEVMDVRHECPKAQNLADKYLYENLVRIHRAGEGAPYTGIKPEGTPMEKEIIAADKSILEESLIPFEGVVDAEKIAELEESFKKVMETKNFDVNDIDAGRKYVEAYVTFTHLAEGKHAEEGEAHGAHEAIEASSEVDHEKEDIAKSIWIPWLLAGVFLATTILALFNPKKRIK